MSLEVEYVRLNTIKPYIRNAKKHPKEQIAQIAQSIEEFGFNDPIAVWHGEIVEGHGRYLAARLLGLDVVPIIRLDELTDEQRRAYTLVHNKLTLNSEFDVKMLDFELKNIDLDLSAYDFELPEKKAKAENITDRETDPLPRLQHNCFDNFEREFRPEVCGKYDIPKLAKTKTTGKEFARFCDWKETDDHGKLIAHFYYDDYKFIATWRDPDIYVDRLRAFKAVIAPDFSLYTDFPLALQIMSCYKRNWLGAYWQSIGLDVIPDVVWGEEKTFEFCFDGIPKGGTVAVSSVGVKRDKEWNGSGGDIFRKGYDEMLRRLEPKTVLYYGDMIDGLEGNIIRIPSYYEQKRKTLGKARENDGQR